MIKRAIAIYIALIFCGIKAASAQSIEQQLHQVTEAWTNETGIYVPRVVRQKFFEALSDRIAATVDPQINALAHAESQERLRRNHEALPNEAQATDRARLANAIGRLATVQTVGLWLERFPTIRVIVQPMPPKEFLLTINGEPCPATEKAMYRVPAGAVTIRVWRQGSAPCEKTYNTVAGAVYDVQCAF